MCLHIGDISAGRKTSSTFPASNALSSSHSRADDRNKGVDLRPVVISWACWCKATNFWGSKPRRRKGSNEGWGGHVCGAAEATGVIGRELTGNHFSISFCCHYSCETQRAYGDCTFPLIHAQWLGCCRWNRLVTTKSPFSLFLHKATPKKMKIFQNKIIL